MSNIELEEEVKSAQKAHFGVPQNSKDSPRILSTPPRKIYHQLKFRPQTGEELEIQRGLAEFLSERQGFFPIGEAQMVSAARDYLRFQIPYLKKTDNEWYEEMAVDDEFAENGSFKFLQICLENGITPNNLSDDFLPTKHRSLNQALLKAREKGFSIPDEFTTERPTSYGKEEAWYAARQIALSQRSYWDDNEDFDTRSPIVSTILSSFLVPDPDVPNKIPFIIDQVWIVRESNARLRFLAIEIDSAFHLSKEQQKKDQIRDEKLARQGFEVYRIADWWCRIDAWRVIAEIYSKADIIANAELKFLGSHWQSIDEYICEECNEPMIRYDYDWVVKDYDDYGYEDDYESYKIVHKSCLDLN